jgi:putative membrane protein insertion efficiency factor
MKHICIWLVRFYRKFLSPLKGGPCCRFVPSCSTYSIEAFEKRGFFMGMILTAWRILRCNPCNAGGYDPVPEKGFRYKGPRTIPSVCDDDCCVNSDPCRGDDGKGSVQEAHCESTASHKEDEESHS